MVNTSTTTLLSFFIQNDKTLLSLYFYIIIHFCQLKKYLLSYSFIMNFWKNVDSELIYLGKTRKELASAVGFDATNISFGIKRNSVPAADTALKVARFLGVSLDYLLDMVEPERQNSSSPQIQEIENKIRRFSQNDLNTILTVVNALNEKY